MKHYADLYVGDFCSPDNKLNIEYLCNSPVPEEDMLFGYAAWNGEELIGIDGDNYFLNDPIYAYEWNDEEYLTIWMEVAWS